MTHRTYIEIPVDVEFDVIPGSPEMPNSEGVETTVQLTGIRPVMHNPTWALVTPEQFCALKEEVINALRKAGE